MYVPLIVRLNNDQKPSINHLTWNVGLADFRRFLKDQGCKNIGGKGGHEKWVRSDLTRPLTIQSHVDPVPEFIVKQILGHLKIDRKDVEF